MDTPYLDHSVLNFVFFSIRFSIRQFFEGFSGIAAEDIHHSQDESDKLKKVRSELCCIPQIHSKVDKQKRSSTSNCRIETNTNT